MRYRRFATDFRYEERGNLWMDTLTGGFTDEKIDLGQTSQIFSVCGLQDVRIRPVVEGHYQVELLEGRSPRVGTATPSPTATTTAKMAIFWPVSQVGSLVFMVGS